MRSAGMAVVACLAVSVAEATDEATLDVRTKTDARFVTKPGAAKVAEGTKITFAVSDPTDVEVAILDAKGRVVRHLAAGVLGGKTPPPAPLKSGLAQTLEWDTKDDLGKPAEGGPFRARVRLGLKPAFSHLIGASPEIHGGVVGLGCDGKGNLHVMYRYGGISHHYTSMAIKTYDREGKYVRQVMPYPADLAPGKRRGVKWIDFDDGPSVPLVFHGHSRGLYPETGAGNRQSILVRPDGKLVTTSDHFDRPSGITARRVLVLGPDGSIGTDYLGPRIQRGRAGGWIMAALSPDGKAIYLSGARTRKGPVPAVFRTTWGNQDEPEVFVGDEAKPGSDEKSFAEPRGIATDKAGNVYVCDHMNNRVAVFSPAGKPIGSLPAPDADLVAVHPKTGAVYVLTTKSNPKYKTTNWGSGANFLEKKLLKFKDYRAVNPSAVLDMPQERTARPLMALDSSANEPVIWLAGLRWGDGRIRRIVDKGTKFEGAGAPISARVPEEAVGTDFLDIAVDRHTEELLVRDSSRRSIGAKRFNGDSGSYLGRVAFKSKMARGYWGEAAFSWDGKTILHSTSLEKHYLFDRKGTPVPWPGLGANELDGIPQGFTHARGHAPGPDGSFYFLHHLEHRDYQRGAVSQVDPSGKIVRRAFIQVQAPVGGIRVDLKGNVYVGAQVKPKGAQLPRWFEGKVPSEQSPWYVNMYGSVLKFEPAGGAVALGDGELMVGGPRYRPATAKGLAWAYHGVSPMPTRKVTRCSCQVPRFDVDLFGRVFVPDAFRFSVAVLDNNANPITRFGAYGNQDSRGSEGPIKAPEIPFGWVHSVQVTDRNAYVSDMVNHRVVAVRLDATAEETCAVR